MHDPELLAFLRVDPLGKPRMTQRDKWARRPPVIRYRSFCDDLRAGWGDKPVPNAVGLRFAIPMPRSWSTKKRAGLDGQPHQQKPDIDNLVKAVLDALLKDDASVHTVHASKVWTAGPGTVEIYHP